MNLDITHKASGTTRMEEYVPTLDVRNDAGTIELVENNAINIVHDLLLNKLKV